MLQAVINSESYSTYVVQLTALTIRHTCQIKCHVTLLIVTSPLIRQTRSNCQICQMLATL